MRRLLLTTCLLAALAVSPVGLAATTYTLHPGDSLTVTGRTGSIRGSGSARRATGRVYVTATWNEHPPYVVATPQTTADGRYSVRFAPSRRGTYRLQIVTPDERTLRYIVHIV